MKLTYADIVELFWYALSFHDSEEDAYNDVQMITDEARREGFLLLTITEAYAEALKG